jgi:hypothetical protein
MRREIRRLIVAVALTGLVLGSKADSPMAASRTPATRPILFAPLDHGRPVLPHVLVTALDFASDGTIYTGGRPVLWNPHALSWLVPTGSVWLVSHDHGRTWTQRSATTSTTVLRQAALQQRVLPWRDHTRWPVDFVANTLAVDPHQPRIVYAAGCMNGATESYSVRYRDMGTSLFWLECALLNADPDTQGYALLRSADGGQSWQDAVAHRVQGQASGVFGQAEDVIIDPHNSQRVYVAVAHLGLLRSSDGGYSWKRVSAAPWFAWLAMDPIDPRVLYVTGSGGPLSLFPAFYRSSDGGPPGYGNLIRTSTSRSSGPPCTVPTAMPAKGSIPAPMADATGASFGRASPPAPGYTVPWSASATAG